MHPMFKRLYVDSYGFKKIILSILNKSILVFVFFGLQRPIEVGIIIIILYDYYYVHIIVVVTYVI